MGLTSEYAVVYKPESTPASKPDSVRGLRLESRGIKWVRVQFVDYTSTVRFRILPIAYFKKVCETLRPSLLFDLSLLGAGVSQSEGSTEEDWERECLYVIDFGSFRACPYAPGHATIMGWFEEKTTSPMGSLSMKLCPRTMLRNIVDEAKSKAGLVFLAGFETQFVLLNPRDASGETAVSQTGWGSSREHRTGSAEGSVLEEIAENLLDVGIEVQAMHPGAGQRQYELVTGPLPPLDAADALVHTRETIYNVAHKHGLRATLAPRPSPHAHRNSTHLHISLHTSKTASSPRRSSDARYAPTLTSAEGAFLQTLVEHLPALSALTYPTSTSYDDDRDQTIYAAWSSTRKDIPVRVCGDRGAHHIEVRTIDGTANPYLVLAGVLLAGLQGVLSNAELKVGDCRKSIAKMDDVERRDLGLEAVVPLPKTIGDARTSLREDGYLFGKLGADFVEKYLATNESLERDIAQTTQEDTLACMIERY